MGTTHVLDDLAGRLAAGERFSRADAERVLACPDLVSVGVIGEQARQVRTGSRVTFGRVVVVDGTELPELPAGAGEIRLEGDVSSVDEMLGRVRVLAPATKNRLLTGFALPQLVTLCGGDLRRLTELAARLSAAGLVAVASVPIDRAGSDVALAEQVQAVVAGGLGAWRLTVEQAGAADRLLLIERAAALQAATGTARAFAPLPRVDRADSPSTGYDDVKLVAAARLRCADIEFIQVDWPLYGPKLAQVAITFGANDIDGIAADAPADLGPRRAPLEEIRRQVRAAGGEPVERDARYELRS